MKQKYLISMSTEIEELSIQEYAELEKGEYAFVCEEVYNIGDFRNNMADGAEGLVSVVRRPNMYPRQDFGERIAQEIIDLLNHESGATSSELLIDDKDDFIQEKDDIDPRVVYEDEAEATDEKKDEDSDLKKDEEPEKEGDNDDKK